MDSMHRYNIKNSKQAENPITLKHNSAIRFLKHKILVARCDEFDNYYIMTAASLEY